MMAPTQLVKVSVVIDRNPKVIQCMKDCTAEELCIKLCDQYKIPPLTRTLFALRIRGTNNFLKDNSKVLDSTRDYELRIRYKIPRPEQLNTLDETTFDYYFQQARNDVYGNRVPEIKYPHHKDVLLGLGIVAMTLAVCECKLPQKNVESNYKKYIPKEVVKKHGMFAKQYAQQYLKKLCDGNHPMYKLKINYLQEVYAWAPNYLAEEYDGVIWKKSDKECIPVKLVVAPFDPQTPGLKLYNTVDHEWNHLCTIEDLVYMTRNANCFLEVSKRGNPLFFKFKTEDQLSSFISVCDGYYRLMVKWTFNLSKDDETPSLKELHRMRCHGPVGGFFSFRKLDDRGNKRHGTYIMRQCQDYYNIYYLDVCTKNGTKESYKLEYKLKLIKDKEVETYWLFNDEVKYGSLKELIESHQDPNEKIFLNECILPSEYDNCQLLLCGQIQKAGQRVDQADLQKILTENKSPRCLLNKDILLYTGSEKTSSHNIMVTYKALWKLDETKKIVVAFKTLQKDKANDYLKDFIDIANKWACVHSSAIVQLYGITLSSPTALVLEHLPGGPFDKYLQLKKKDRNEKDKNNKNKNDDEEIKDIHLLKVAAGLSRALWYLSESGVVHGDIRCRKLLLASHKGDHIVVKLSGPTLREYEPDDVHWIPVDFYSDMNLAKRSVLGDIWAFATTVWEIYNFGQSPTKMNPVLTKKGYEKGDRLPWPERCPREVWALLDDCWNNETTAPRPQAIMRDMHHLLHMEYVPMPHTYERPYISNDTDQSDTMTTDKLSDAGSHKSLLSSDSICSTNGVNSDIDCHSFEDRIANFESKPLPAAPRLALGGFGPAPDDQPRNMQCIVSQGKTYTVIKELRIGCGNYGDVYKGIMEDDANNAERRYVAVKTLKAREQDPDFYKDHDNEHNVMKSLYHPNIVEILGFSKNPPEVMIVMEYLELGSLYYYLKFNKTKLSLLNLLKYCLDIASGMDYISSKNIVHRDLAARNILVKDKDHVKISDFGLARMLSREQDDYRVINTTRELPFNWYAPESVVNPFPFSTKSDVWSYGVTVWEIFSYAKPVPPFNLNTMRPEERPSSFIIPDGCPNDVFMKLMVKCWDLEPKNRPSFIDLTEECRSLIQAHGGHSDRR